MWNPGFGDVGSSGMAFFFSLFCGSGLRLWKACGVPARDTGKKAL